MTESVLHSVRVVLYEPQDAVNIAAAVRAMKNMGVRDLVLVRPVAFSAYRLEGIAHDTLDVIERIRVVETLEEAVSDCIHVAAFSARRRRHRWQTATPRELAAPFLAHASEGAVALLFGREDHGLPNEALDRANTLVTIPTTTHASLNLAQAVLVALYELHLAAGDATREIAPPRKFASPATNQQHELLIADQERALEAIEFFKTRYREHIVRSLRSFNFRTGPDAREIDLMRAMAIEVVRSMERFKRERGEPAGHESSEKMIPSASEGQRDSEEAS